MVPSLPILAASPRPLVEAPPDLVAATLAGCPSHYCMQSGELARRASGCQIGVATFAARVCVASAKVLGFFERHVDRGGTLFVHRPTAPTTKPPAPPPPPPPHTPAPMTKPPPPQHAQAAPAQTGHSGILSAAKALGQTFVGEARWGPAGGGPLLVTRRWRSHGASWAALRSVERGAHLGGSLRAGSVRAGAGRSSSCGAAVRPLPASATGRRLRAERLPQGVSGTTTLVVRVVSMSARPDTAQCVVQ